MGIDWKEFKAPSGETWAEAQTFTRWLNWHIFLFRYYKQLAEILQVPEELLIADDVEITIVSKKNLTTPLVMKSDLG